MPRVPVAGVEAMSITSILSDYRVAFLGGLLMTLKLFLAASIPGIVFGSLLGVFGSKWTHWVGLPCRFMSFTLSGVPILVFLFVAHYPVQALLGIVVDPFYTASAVLLIVNVFAVADVVRTVLLDFPSQYVAAGRVCGLTDTAIVRHIGFPICVRQVIPELVRLQVVVLQATLFASLISVEELFRVAQRVNANIYRPVEIYVGLGILFLAICLPLNGLVYWLRGHFTRKIAER